MKSGDMVGFLVPISLLLLDKTHIFASALMLAILPLAILLAGFQGQPAKKEDNVALRVAILGDLVLLSFSA
jgi:hypothetical protein